MSSTLSVLAAGLLCPQVGVQVANVSGAMQTMQGIGASGAWWPMDLYYYPESVKENVSYLLFSSDTLGLTSYRYNVGGGGQGVGTPDRAPETTYVSATVSNFSADPQGTYFLRAAAKYKVPILTAFVNSAPTAFTTNGYNCGGYLNESDLVPYSDYLAGVINYWKGEGVDFSYVSAMNEPDDVYNQCGQEGMGVNATQRYPLVSTLRSVLDSAGLTSVQIQADESSATGNFEATSSIWLAEGGPYIGVFSHHDYGFGTDTQVQLMGEQERNLSGGKETWFSEICCFVGVDGSTDPSSPLTYGQGYDPTMLSALQLGLLLYQSFTVTLDAHFDWWTALSLELGCDPVSNSTCVTSINTAGWNDGLLYYDPNYATNGNYAIYLTKRYFLMKHFTHAIPPGSVRYNVTSASGSEVRMMAFKMPDGQWSVVAMNPTSSAEVIAFDTAQMGTQVGLTGVYLTNGDVDWEGVGTMSIGACADAASAFIGVVPAMSIVSVYFST